MKKTARQQGIQDFIDFLEQYNAVMAGSSGFPKAFREFCEANKVHLNLETIPQICYLGWCRKEKA